MARPAAPTDTRARILETTWRLMEKDISVRIADIAAESGVSRQAVYLHFGDRQGLVHHRAREHRRQHAGDARVDADRAERSAAEHLQGQ